MNAKEGTDLPALLRELHATGARFVVVGGMAANVHGSARLTLDLDVVYARGADDLDRLARGLSHLRPYLRGAPPGLPFRLDVATLRRGLNFTLDTRLGPLDLLGEVAGGGRYEDLEPRSQEVELFGMRVRCLDLVTLIAVKRAAGRPKDLEAIAELEALVEERRAVGLPPE